MIIKHLTLLWLVLGLVAGASAYAVYSGQNSRAHQNDALRSIICRIDAAQQASPVLTKKEKHQAGVFWQKAAEHAHLRPCYP